MKKKPLKVRETRQERSLTVAEEVQALKVFCSELNREPLPVAEELALIRRAQANDEDAKSRLIGAHFDVIVRKAKGYARFNLLPFRDLFQEGVVGFLRALKRFTPVRGKTLAAFAARRINGAMLDALDEKAVLLRVPVYLHRLINQYRDDHRSMTQRLHREPTRPEMAEEMKTTVKKIELLEQLSRPITSLSTPLSSVESSDDHRDDIDSSTGSQTTIGHRPWRRR